MDTDEYLCDALRDLDVFRTTLKEEIRQASPAQPLFSVEMDVAHLTDECIDALVRVVINIVKDNVPNGWSYSIRHDHGKHCVRASIDGDGFDILTAVDKLVFD